MTRRALTPDNMTDRNWWSSPRYWAERIVGGVIFTCAVGLIHTLIFHIEGH